MKTLKDILPLVVGITKKELAIRLDKKSPLFNYSAETGLSSYHNYTRNELIEHCIQFDVDMVPENTKMQRTIEWQRKYSEATGTKFNNYNSHIFQG